jgi:hypothetical protein
MSQFSSVTIEQARVAKQGLKTKFAQDFASAASPVVGIGLTRVNTAEWAVRVNLDHAPTATEKQSLPDRFQGVQIKYEVTGLPKKAL